MADCDVARLKNTAFEFEPRGKCLGLSDQIGNDIDNDDSN